jgi:hypothetical protein
LVKGEREREREEGERKRERDREIERERENERERRRHLKSRGGIKFRAVYSREHAPKCYTFAV